MDEGTVNIAIDHVDEDPVHNHQDPPIVQLTNVHKTFMLGHEGIAALRGVNLSIYPGDWLIIYGTSGGGKTSLLNIIGTIDKPTKGMVRIGDQIISSLISNDALADVRLQQLGFVFQSFNLISSMTAMENVELPMTLSGKISSGRRKTLVAESLEKVGLGHRLNHFPNQLSGGEQQRVAIARSIANNPSILLLDEPTGDLDTVNTNRIINLLHRLNCELGMTLVMVTHDVNLKKFAHRIVHVRDGKITREERISSDVRAKAISELGESLANMKLGSLTKTSESVSTPTPLHPESSSRPLDAAIRRTDYITHTRAPTDYVTHSTKAIERAKQLRKIHCSSNSLSANGKFQIRNPSTLVDFKKVVQI